jgi:hypothetical protein
MCSLRLKFLPSITRNDLNYYFCLHIDCHPRVFFFSSFEKSFVEKKKSFPIALYSPAPSLHLVRGLERVILLHLWLVRNPERRISIF